MQVNFHMYPGSSEGAKSKHNVSVLWLVRKPDHPFMYPFIRWMNLVADKQVNNGKTMKMLTCQMWHNKRGRDPVNKVEVELILEPWLKLCSQQSRNRNQLKRQNYFFLYSEECKVKMSHLNRFTKSLSNFGIRSLLCI